MSTIIGKIASLDGKFYIKGVDGSLRKLSEGDEIFEGDTVVGDKGNSLVDSMIVSMTDGTDMLVLGQDKQLFDSSLSSGEFALEETVTQKDALQKLLEDNGDIENLEDIETAAGGEATAESTEGGEAVFAVFNNAITDISAALRERGFGEYSRVGNDTDDGERTRLGVDREAPDAPTLSVYTDSGDSNSDNITNVIALKGTAEANSIVSLFLVGSEDPFAVVVADGSGNWEWTDLVGLNLSGTDSFEIIATATDAWGNESEPSSVLDVTFDTVAEAGVVTVDTIAADDIINAAENAEATQTVSGTAIGGDIETGDSVRVTVNGKDYNTTVLANGTYIVEVDTADLVADNSVEVDVSSIDIAGNSVITEASRDITVDTVAKALNDVASTDEDSSVTINVLLNDEADSIITSVDTPLNAAGEVLGSVEIVTVAGVQQIKFTPADNFDSLNAGQESDVSLVYHIEDSVGNEASATVTVTIHGLNNDLTYVSESAGYKNVVGIYEVDTQGNPISGTVVIDDQNGMVSGTHLADLDPTKDYDFFIIANGADEIDESSVISFDNSGDKPLLLINGNAALHPVYFTEPSFNPDGEDHFKFELDGNGGTKISIEDLPNLGDADFGDVVLYTNFEMNNKIDVDADLADASDTGSSNTDDITSDNTPTITGNTEAGASVVITNEAGNVIGSGVANKYGDYSITTSALENGTQMLSITATDVDGNSALTTQNITVDTIAFDAPVITNITDNAGDYSSVTLYGTGDAGAIITLYSKDGSTTAGNNTNLNGYAEVDTSANEIIVDANGNWSLDISSLANTPVNDNEFFKAVQTDKAGNNSLESNTVHFWHGTWENVETEVEDDFILMGNGDDILQINDNDIDDRVVADGGNGRDAALFSGNFADYVITTDANGNTIVTESVASDSDGNGVGDVNELRNFETIKFADGTYDVAARVFYTVTEGTMTQTVEVGVEFLLGTKDLNSGNKSDWDATGVTITATNSNGNSTVGFDNHSQMSSTHQGIGLGVGGGDNNQIDKNEKLTISFDNPVKAGAEIGLSGLGGNFVENGTIDASAHWVAYKDDNEVSTGDIQIISTSKTADDASFTVDATFDKIEFSVDYMGDSTINSNFTVKYIDGEYLTEVEQTIDFDTLAFEDSIDLSAISENSDVVNNIEHLDLDNGISQTVQLDINDILIMTDADNILRIDGEATDILALDTMANGSGEWTLGDTQIESDSGKIYDVYSGISDNGSNVTIEVNTLIQIDES